MKKKKRECKLQNHKEKKSNKKQLKNSRKKEVK